MRGGLFAMLFLIIYICPMGGDSKSYGQFCRYWCRTMNHRYYCCPSGKTENWIEHAWYNFFYPLLSIIADESPSYEQPWSEILVEEEKSEKRCPPMRTHCPRSYDWYQPPTSCHDDENCSKWEKCCYDVCLEHKTCKHIE